MKLIGGAFLLVIALALSGCGNGGNDGPTAAQKAAASKSAAAEKSAEARQAARAKRKAHLTALYTECRNAMKPLDDKLSDLGARLEVGLNFSDYSTRVGNARVAYDRLIRNLKSGPVSGACLRHVGEPLEKSLNAYVSAYNTWNNCVNDDYCTFDKGSASLKKAQAKWSQAATAEDKAATALSNMQP